ncbi:hypothetical protein BJX63DRAFT_414062 [Aspergillus granulosus]|uniref:Uncharacterized protein n=1 Tax=Aspergillus granulosus TaxID=176169 RepID=A0ABR4GUN4_9EURO
MNDDEAIEIVRFMDLPFDNFVIEHWDPASALSKHEQKWSLVERWIKLGDRGRKQYFEPRLCEHEIPAHVPRDLLTPRERAADGEYEKTFWIRTWFGEKNNAESQRAADDDYKQLYLFALQRCDEGNEGPEFLDERFLFDHLDIDAADLRDGNMVARQWTTPEWLVDAFMRYPDQLSGLASFGVDLESDGVDGDQRLLIGIADRKACQEGWVLLLGVNHKGQILPYRVRERASSVDLVVNDWNEDSIDLRQLFADPNQAGEELYMRAGSGWDI